MVDNKVVLVVESHNNNNNNMPTLTCEICVYGNAIAETVNAQQILQPYEVAIYSDHDIVITVTNKSISTTKFIKKFTIYLRWQVVNCE